MSDKVAQTYRERVALGEIEADPAQAWAATRLDALATALESWQPAGGLMARLRRTRPAAPKGLYVHGAVGRGKTMLMDLFFEATAFTPKVRAHFHEFMADVHDRIAAARKSVPGDPIPAVARDMAKSARLLCFDELHVTDIADAMILGRLFSALWEEGVVVVATSNARPSELYRNGLNRQLFLPFIDLISANMEVVELKAAKDFRLEKLAGRPLYFAPLDDRALTEMEAHWERLTGHHLPAPADLDVKGRKVHVPLASMGVARFHFADLCELPLGALDYLHVAHAYHTVLIEGIPLLTPERRNEARRFITLIDTFYDARVTLIASAEAEPAALYPSGDGAVLFERTVSRLMEMRSEGYLVTRERRLNHAPIPGRNPSDAEPPQDE